MKTTLAVIASATALSALALTGCGGSSSSASTPAAATTTPATAPMATSAASAPMADMVEVTLGGAKRFSLVTTAGTAPAGSVTFTARNNGSVVHEMVVVRTDVKAAAMPSTGGKVSETGAVGETFDVAAGATKTLTLNLPKGHYALICNLPGHYDGGMHSDFVVA